jgi:CRP-like cAMP-binding protein
METSQNAKDTETILALLAKMPVLKMFTRPQLAQILKFTKIYVYEFGESIIEEGQPGKTIHILISGSALVVKGGVKLGALEKPGDVFGEMSVVDGSLRSASVVARKKTICLCIDTAFVESIGADQDVMLCQNILFRAISEILAGRLRAMNEENVRLLAKTSKESPPPGKK